MLGGNVSLVLVNVSNETIVTSVALASSLVSTVSGSLQIHDAWNDIAMESTTGYAWNSEHLSAFDLSFDPFQPRVLTIRPARS